MNTIQRVKANARWRSTKVLGDLLERRLSPPETIQSVRDRDVADFDGLVETLRSLGTDSFAVCGDDYHAEGGLRLQQRTNEFAALCIFLRGRNPKGAYLEIGTASGGATKLIQEQLRAPQVLSVDDGRHPDAYLQRTHLADIADFVQYVGDSHAPAAAAFIREKLDHPLAVAYIDGDHSYEGVRKDTLMVRPFTQPGTLLIYHDTVAVPEVQRHWREGAATGLFSPLAHFVDDRPGALGISVAEITSTNRPMTALRNLL